MATVVVLGAGYAGIRAIKFLKKAAPLGTKIVLVDQHAEHVEKTNLHEVAAGTIDPDKITYNIPDIVGDQVDFIQDRVVNVDLDAKSVQLAKRETPLTYDYVVLALGFQAETFGLQGATENALQLEDLQTAEAVYQHIEQRLADYHQTQDPNDLNIAICGAGFTGVELIGELTHSLPRLQVKYQTPPVKVYCLEMMTKILPMFDSSLADYAMRFMDRNNVQMLLGAKITRIDPGAVVYEDSDGNEQKVNANTIVWTVGVSGSHVIADSGLPQKRNRVVTEPDLSMTDHPEAFIVGDVAAVMDPDSKRPYPPTAQIALKAGERAGLNIAAKLRGYHSKAFVYKSDGTVGSLGDSDAIAEITSENIKLKGYPASALKKVITDRSLLKGANIATMLRKGRYDLFH